MEEKNLKEMIVMKKDAFAFYKEWKDAVIGLPDDVRLEFYEAVIEYGTSGVISESLQPMALLAFNFAKTRMDQDEERCNEIRRKRSEAGKKGGAKVGNDNARKNKQIQTKQAKQANGCFEENPFIPSDKEIPPIPPIEINNPIIPKEEPALTGLSKTSLDSDNSAGMCEDIVRFYNETVKKTSVSKCIALTEKRKQSIRLRIKEFGMDKVKEAITITASSSFCNGHNDRNWIADFDFVFNANKMAKILEGKFTDKTTPPLTDDDKQFNAWFNHKFMRLSKMKETLTREQFMSIKNMGYTDDDIIRKLSYMENRSDIYKYVSTYQLLKNWLE